MLSKEVLFDLGKTRKLNSMKKLIFTLSGLVCMASLSIGQLVNQGGTITIQPGATLIVETDIDNQSGSTITNQGTIVVEEDFINNGTLNSSATTSKVIFRGGLASELTSGGDSIYHLEFDKTANDVTLLDDAYIINEVEFTQNGKFVLGDNNMTLSETATFTGAGADRYVDASAAGLLKKEYIVDANFTFPVGDADDYSPLSSVLTGGTYAPGADMGVSVVDDTLDMIPVDATEFISRYWNVELDGITGPTENTVTGTYVAADVEGADATLISGTSFAGGAFDYTNSTGDDVSRTVTSRIDGQASADFTGTNKFGQIDMKIFLEAAYSSGSNMATTINSTLPLTSPYDPGVSIETMPADIVDWVEIQILDATNTLLSSHSALLKENGDIVSLSGSGNALLKNAPANGKILLNHRNHLPIRTDGTLDLYNIPAEIDFGTNPPELYVDVANTINDAQKLKNGKYVLWSGDTNGDDQIIYNGGGSDRIPILIEVGPATTTNVVTAYSNNDVNLDGNVIYNGGGADRIPILINVSPATTTRVLSAHK